MLEPQNVAMRQKVVNLADSVVGFHEESMGDEREAQVILRAYTFALVTGTFLLVVVSALLALFGYWAFALGSLVFGALQSYLAIMYASACGVSLYQLEERTSVRRKRASISMYLVLVAVIFGARGFQLYQGRPVFGSHGVVESALTNAPMQPDAQFWGMLTGAVCGVLAVAGARTLGSKRRENKQSLVDLVDED